MTTQLSPGQLIFNQRLLAEHSLPEKDAKALYAEIQENFDCDHLDFHHAIKSSNSCLQMMKLEIVAVSMLQEDTRVRHFALINSQPDETAKLVFQPLLFQPPETQQFVKCVLQKLVDEGEATRASLVNLKNDVPGNKVNLELADNVVDKLLREKWLVHDESKSRTSNSTKVQLGPRTFCELAHLLTEEFGMPPEDLPQQIYYRE